MYECRNNKTLSARNQVSQQGDCWGRITTFLDSSLYAKKCKVHIAPIHQHHNFRKSTVDNMSYYQMTSAVIFQSS